MPGDFDLAMFTLGPTGALRHRRPFTEATIAEIRGVRAVTGADVVFQIEVPVELVMVAKAPRTGPVGAAELARPAITGLAAAAPVGSQFGVHLCLGDMNNRALGSMKDVGPLVALSNAIVAGWPDGRPLVFMHAPFSAADHPAPTDPAFYAPLADLTVPPGVRFSAGFAHEAQSRRRPASGPGTDRHPGRLGRGHRFRLRARPPFRRSRPGSAGTHRRALPGLTGPVRNPSARQSDTAAEY